jgi:Zn-dependent peptidase ImmA (M78 family)
MTAKSETWRALIADGELHLQMSEEDAYELAQLAQREGVSEEVYLRRRLGLSDEPKANKP